MENFRSSKYIERYENVSFDLQNPIIIPGNAIYQQKTGYRFVDESSPLDWYNAFLEIDFTVQKLADGVAFVPADHVGTVNGVYSFIKQLKGDFNGINVNDSPNINHAINVKNLLDFSDVYSNKIGPTSFLTRKMA